MNAFTVQILSNENSYRKRAKEKRKKNSLHHIHFSRYEVHYYNCKKDILNLVVKVNDVGANCEHNNDSLF